MLNYFSSFNLHVLVACDVFYLSTEHPLFAGLEPFFFFLNNPPPTEISPLPLHDALPIWRRSSRSSRHPPEAATGWSARTVPSTPTATPPGTAPSTTSASTGRSSDWPRPPTARATGW